MNTRFLLMAEFNTSDIPLEAVASKYLGLTMREAATRAKYNELPFPVFRAGSQKSPWLVNVSDLANFLDKTRENAKKEWERVNGVKAA